MEESVLEGIEEYIDSGERAALCQARGHIGCTVDYSAGRNRYIGFLISLATRSYKGRRIGLDCANGSTWQMAKSIFDALGADTYVIANSPDGLNINVDCGSTHIGNLRKFVLENQAGRGLRLRRRRGPLSCRGREGERGHRRPYPVRLRQIHEGQAACSGTPRWSPRSCPTWAFTRRWTRSASAMKRPPWATSTWRRTCAQNGYLIGGEQSGHIIFGRLANTGDGLLTAIKLMEAMTETKQPLSVLASPVTIYPQLLKNVVVTDKDETMECAEVKNAVEKAERELAGSGRVLLRKSGTEPVLRVMVEASSDELCEKYVDYIIGVMRDAGRLVKVK
jgi:phosphoglucosamine mutase